MKKSLNKKNQALSNRLMESWGYAPKKEGNEKTDKHDDNPKLKGGQKNLPDALQQGIIDSAKEDTNEAKEICKKCKKDPCECEKNEEIDKAIRESIEAQGLKIEDLTEEEYNSLKEGFLDRMRAKASGVGAAIKGLGGDIKRGVQAFRGQAAPEVDKTARKQGAQMQKLAQIKIAKIQKLQDDLLNDMKKLGLSDTLVNQAKGNLSAAMTRLKGLLPAEDPRDDDQRQADAAGIGANSNVVNLPNQPNPAAAEE